jgi:uncharacterized protein YjgD (DUF1641 family)
LERGDEKLLKLLDLLEENYEALEALMKLLAAMKRSGLLDALVEVAERGDELFNAIARPEVMKGLGNAMMLFYMISQLDNFKLMAAAEALPKCMEEAEKAAARGGGMSIRELLRTMTSPEMAALLRALTAATGCMMRGGEAQGRG